MPLLFYTQTFQLLADKSWNWLLRVFNVCTMGSKCLVSFFSDKSQTYHEWAPSSVFNFIPALLCFRQMRNFVVEFVVNFTKFQLISTVCRQLHKLSTGLFVLCVLSLRKKTKYIHCLKCQLGESAFCTDSGKILGIKHFSKAK